MCTIQLPYKITSSLDGYNELSKLYFNMAELVKHNKEVKVDFSHCKELDGNLCAAVGAIFDRFSNNASIMIRASFDKKVSKILSRNHFLKAFQETTDLAERENFMKYFRFGTNDAEGFKKYIDEWLIRKQKFPEHTKTVGNNLVASIYEIYANAAMHGETNFVYLCGEYKEETTTFDMAIVDLGETIPNNVNTFFSKKGMQRVTDCEAIAWAFIEGNTTKENTGGLGLSLLKEFIELNKGALHLVSAGGFVEYANGKFNYHNLDKVFPGTIVNIKFNFNDSKRYLMSSEKPDFNDLL